MSLKGIVLSALHLIVFSSVYIAACAMMMIYQSNHLLDLRYDTFHYFLFVFCSTLCSYNFHWGLSTDAESTLVRLTWTRNHLRLHALLFGISAIGAAASFIYFIEHWFVMSIAVILTFLYSAPKLPFLTWLRKIAIGKTIFLSMVWMYVTTALPLFLDGRSWTANDMLFCISRFFFIYSICILFDFRDRDWDRKEGIKSMITYLSDKGVDRLFYISMLIFALATAAMYLTGLHWRYVLLIFVPGVIMLPLYKIGKKNFSDYLYYIILDGMMMLSALLTSVFI